MLGAGGLQPPCPICVHGNASPLTLTLTLTLDGKSHLFYFRNLLFPNIDYTLDLVWCKLAHPKVDVNTFLMSYGSLPESQ